MGYPANILAPTHTRLHGLDTLRSLAILSVVLYHLLNVLPEAIAPVTQFGWMGVDLFFVLSGYLIGAQILRSHAAGRPVGTLAFYRRRAFRILPAYAVVLSLYLAVPGWREQPGLAPWWKLVSFTENLLFVPTQRAFSHVWSLCVEEHFYLLLPLLVGAMYRKPSARRTAGLIATVVVAGIVLRWWLLLHCGDDYYRLIYYPTWTRLDGLVAGVTLAAVKVYRPRWWQLALGRGHSLLLAGSACVAVVVWLFHDHGMGETSGAGAWGTVVGFPLLAFGLAMLVVSAQSRNGWLSRVRVPGASLGAGLAFSLYLTHKAAAPVVRGWLPDQTESRGVLAAAIYAVTCLAAAAALHLAVERPFLRLREHLDRQPERVTAEIHTEPAL